jgi:diaminopimelate decarboxylase
MRPALYDAEHEIWPVREAPRDAERALIDVVGPVCESTDTFARDVSLPPLVTEDLIAFMTAGAYGAVMANQYNGRPLVPEVLVNGDRFHVVRRRPTMAEMAALEDTPPWLE